MSGWEGKTPRGFGITKFEMLDPKVGETSHFSVQESSLATERRVWIGADGLRALLTVEEATRVRDALNAFLSDSSDPMLEPDSRFPDRPQTLDFARLSSAIAEQDAVAETLGFQEALGADPTSVLYMAKGRIRALTTYQNVSGAIRSTMLALYLDAFQLGIGFQKRGGQR